MKQFIKSHWILLLLAILVIIFGGVSAKQKNKIDTLKSALYSCEDEKQNLENENEELRYNIDELESELYNCQTELSNCESNKWDLEYELQDTQNELENERWNND